MTSSEPMLHVDDPATDDACDGAAANDDVIACGPPPESPEQVARMLSRMPGERIVAERLLASLPDPFALEQADERAAELLACDVWIGGPQEFVDVMMAHGLVQPDGDERWRVCDAAREYLRSRFNGSELEARLEADKAYLPGYRAIVKHLDHGPAYLPELDHVLAQTDGFAHDRSANYFLDVLEREGVVEWSDGWRLRDDGAELAKRLR